METRELRYFVAVAEELHFGRAADRLGIAQPPLSRAITQLERQLGVTLLQRTSRRVALTAAGAVLLSEGRTILGAVAAAERRTQRAAAGHPSLVLATKAGASGELLVKLLDAYASEPGAIAVDLLLCDSQEQRQLLWQGHADVALMHLPFDSTAGLDTEVLCTERQVAILPATHALAGHTNVRMADVATLPELPLARWPSADGTFPEGPGAEVRNLTQLFQLIALGRTMVIIPESASVDLRRDLVAVPVLDAPVVTTVIAWPQLSRSRAVADLIRVATLPRRTIHCVKYLSDPVYRRKIARQLNKGESLHALRRDLHYANHGIVRSRRLEQQTEQAWCLTVLTNAVICWSTEYYSLAVTELRAAGRDIPDALLAHICPAHSENINFFGVITVDVEAELAKLDDRGLRPLRLTGTTTAVWDTGR